MGAYYGSGARGARRAWARHHRAVVSLCLLILIVDYLLASFLLQVVFA